MRLVPMAALILLAACAEPPPEPLAAATLTLPRPPDPPRRPARTARSPAAPGATVPVWRVTREVTTACADAATLRRLEAELRPGAVPARQIAAARAAGGCVTVFRDSTWRLLGQEGELLRLAPSGEEGVMEPDGLFFRRDAVEPDRAA